MQFTQGGNSSEFVVPEPQLLKLGYVRPGYPFEGDNVVASQSEGLQMFQGSTVDEAYNVREIVPL